MYLYYILFCRCNSIFTFYSLFIIYYNTPFLIFLVFFRVTFIEYFIILVDLLLNFGETECVNNEYYKPKKAE